MNLKIEEFENLQRENDENSDKLNNLYKIEIIDEEGFAIKNRIE